MSTARILVVDDNDSLRRVMKMQLEEAGYVVTLAADGAEACRLLQHSEFHLIITDLRMPTGGMELLRFLEQEGMQTTVIVVTAFGTVESAVEAMRRGAYDYVTKHWILMLCCLWSIAPLSGKRCSMRCAPYAPSSTCVTVSKESLRYRRTFSVYSTRPAVWQSVTLLYSFRAKLGLGGN